MNKPVIVVIGAGNMGGSLISGLVMNEYDPKQIWAVDTDTEKLKKLEKNFNIQTTSDIENILPKANILLLAVKPQILLEIATSFKDTINKSKPLVISIAAGITIKSLSQWLGDQVAIVRAMPNTPALIGCGVTALFSNPMATLEQCTLADEILQAVGATVWVQDEKWLDIVTALSGSGPAYFFYMMEALEKSAVELGLPQELSHTLILQTAYGSALLALESGVSLATLRQQVTSKGGTTEKALAVMDEHKLTEVFRKVINAAKTRSEELAKLAEQD